MPPVVRFAPSPTGKLHIGNVRAALWNWLLARREEGGKFILRIDDTDAERSTAEFEAAIKRDLTWLGLDWDETFKQSERFAAYAAARDRLIEAGRLYPCYETPEELDRKRKLQRARGLPPVYDRAALELSGAEKASLEEAGRRPHWRFKLSREAVTWSDLIRGETTVDTGSVSDPVLIRGDGMYLYTLPSCVDDVDHAITHVLRGEDHVTNTAAQIELIHALGGRPPAFGHHSLIVGKDGEGLSKRLGSLSIGSLREDGLEPEAILSLLARLGTAEPMVATRDRGALAEGFHLDRVGRAPARFDPDELLAANAKILHETGFETVAARLADDGVDEPVWLAARQNCERLRDAAQWATIVRKEIDPVIEDAELTARAAELTPDGLDGESWSTLTAALKEETGKKGRALFMPLRLALTGRASGPDMDSLFALIGADKARARFRGERA